MAWIKKVARKAEKKVFGSKGVKGRYGIGKGKGGFKFLQLAKDLEMVKSRLNVEKKFKDEDVFTNVFGQCNANFEGAYYRDITPIIAQGVAENQRVGNSLKLTGLYMPMSFTGQLACLSPRKIRITLLKVKTADLQVSPQEAFERVWDTNPLTGLRDYHAPRAYRNSKNDGISVVHQRTCYLRAPTLDNGSIGVDQTEMSQNSIKVALKMNEVLRYEGNGQTLPGGIKYILVLQADVGNFAGSGSTLDVPVQSANSGITARCSTRFWYVDN